MEKETFVSGYCRCLDSHRMVAVVTEDSKLIEVDCSFESCPHTPNCTIAQTINGQLNP